MGLLDNFENQALGKVLGGTSNPLASGLLQMIQNQPGGLQGLVQNFHDKGLGGVAHRGWGAGESADFRRPDSPGAGQRAGAGACGQGWDFSGYGGTAIAQLLPGIVSHLTPDGQVPAHNNVMDMVGGLLQNLEKAS